MCDVCKEERKTTSADMISRMVDDFQAQLEAQHRKTWALAMQFAAKTAKVAIDEYNRGCPTDHTIVSVLSNAPCPPIEETKGE